MIGWIKVEDEMPIPHVRVLAWFRDGCKIATLSMSGTNKAGPWYVPELKCWDTGATHWMPLPPRPEAP